MSDIKDLVRLMKQHPEFYEFIRENVTDEGWQLLQPYLVPLHIRLWHWVRGWFR